METEVTGVVRVPRARAGRHPALPKPGGGLLAQLPFHLVLRKGLCRPASHSADPRAGQCSSETASRAQQMSRPPVPFISTHLPSFSLNHFVHLRGEDTPNRHAQSWPPGRGRTGDPVSSPACRPVQRVTSPCCSLPDRSVRIRGSPFVPPVGKGEAVHLLKGCASRRTACRHTATPATRS